MRKIARAFCSTAIAAGSTCLEKETSKVEREGARGMYVSQVFECRFAEISMGLGLQNDGRKALDYCRHSGPAAISTVLIVV